MRRGDPKRKVRGEHKIGCFLLLQSQGVAKRTNLLHLGSHAKHSALRARGRKHVEVTIAIDIGGERRSRLTTKGIARRQVNQMRLEGARGGRRQTTLKL